MANESISRQIVHIGLDGKVGGTSLFDVDDEGRTPFGESGSTVVIFLTTDSEGIQSLHDGVAVGSWEGVDFEVWFDSWYDSTFSEKVGEQLSIIRFLKSEECREREREREREKENGRTNDMEELMDEKKMHSLQSTFESL